MSENWRDRIGCRSVDPAVFEAADLTEARLLCRACPVAAECLADAIRLRDIDGFRAGLTGDERKPLLPKRGADRTVADHTERILRLVAKHWTAKAIALSLDLDVDSVRRVVREHQDRVVRSPRPVSLGVIGLVRRRQALAAIGYGLMELAPRLGVTWTAVANQLQRTRVHPDTYDRWVRMYDELCGTEGPNVRGRGYAVKAGWLPPSAWDPATIDDPDAQPRVDGEVAA